MLLILLMIFFDKVIIGLVP